MSLLQLRDYDFLLFQMSLGDVEDQKGCITAWDPYINSQVGRFSRLLSLPVSSISIWNQSIKTTKQRQIKTTNKSQQPNFSSTTSTPSTRVSQTPNQTRCLELAPSTAATVETVAHSASMPDRRLRMPPIVEGWQRRTRLHASINYQGTSEVTYCESMNSVTNYPSGHEYALSTVIMRCISARVGSWSAINGSDLSRDSCSETGAVKLYTSGVISKYLRNHCCHQVLDVQTCVETLCATSRMVIEHRTTTFMVGPVLI
jgi:hypothetical protein